MSVELKPCPFCGGTACIDRMGTARVSMKISCEYCGCSIETGETWIDEHSSWNTRHIPEGYKLAPVQPTKEMSKAGMAVLQSSNSWATGVYKAMIEAA